MKIRYLWPVLSICAVLGASGCAAFTPGISKDEKPTGEEAYLYGRFYMDAPKLALAVVGHQTMGFSISCAGDKWYLLRFAREEPLQVIRIAPSSCSLVEIVYTDADGMIKSRKPVTDQLMKDVKFDPGVAYYLGDFDAEAEQSMYGRTINMSWRITDIRDDYDKTTMEMKSAFPNIAGIPTENRMIGK